MSRSNFKAVSCLGTEGKAGWKVQATKLVVRAAAPGLDAEALARLAADAKDNCPISAALRGNVKLSVEATLEA